MSRVPPSTRLLLIDDDEVDRLAVKRLLRQSRSSIQVEEATSPPAALSALDMTPFDCVLLDYNIPGSDGLAILNDIRSKGYSVPVIVLTGQGDEELAVELMKAGAADYLNKNALTSERLDRSLRYAIAIHRAEQERRELLERERRARELAQAANRAKDEFLATLSHELRTPLNAIMGWARLLVSGNLDADTARRAIEIIDRNTRLQAQLIEDLLDISRIITGKLRLDVRPTPIRSIIEGAVESVRALADARSVTIEARLDEADEPLPCDPARMQQVVWNLLTNAIKFTPEGGRVAVQVSRTSCDLSIEVTDTGIGIEPDFLPYVFDRFRQQDGASTRSHGGLGLGLSIVQHLVALHGGSVEARSAGVDLGATFVVRLPLVHVRTDAADVEHVLPGVPTPDLTSLAGIQVLVVDNDADARGLLRTVLETCGAVVEEAESARIALARLKERSFDALLSDISMPGEDGYALIRQVRALDAPVRLVPAAAFTARATAADRTRALLAGFQAHIPKPIDPAELAAVVAALVHRTPQNS